MTASEDIDNLVIVPPEKPLKMRAQPIMPPRVKRMWQKLWLKPREERREADRGRNGAGAREHAGSGAGDGRNRPALRPWYGAEYAMLVHRRRRLLSTLVIVTVALGLLKWAAAMPSDITVWTRAAVIVLFVLTFGWIALYFWSSILGFSQLLKRARMPGITYPADVEAALDAEAGIAADDLQVRQNPAAPKVREMASFIKAKTAVLMPIYNEEPAQVMARLLAIGEDLQQAGAGGRFDIFVLSDTTNPKIWVKEEKIWLEAKRILESGSFGAGSCGRVRLVRLNTAFGQAARRAVRIRKQPGGVAELPAARGCISITGGGRRIRRASPATSRISATDGGQNTTLCWCWTPTA